MMGIGHLTAEQQARLILLIDTVTSIRIEFNRMDEEKHGEVYTEEDNVSLEDSLRLFITRH